LRWGFFSLEILKSDITNLHSSIKVLNGIADANGMYQTFRQHF